jgi:GT2 family glycosyltransferase
MVSALVEASLAHPEAGILSPLVLDRADPGVLVSAGMRCDLRHAWQGPPLGRGEPDRGQFDGVHDVDAVSGAAMLVPLEAVRAVGMLDEGLFLYCEDVDWGMRMRTAGRRVCVVGAARLWHGVATASGGEISPNALYYTTRNTYVIADRHVPMRGLRRRARHAEITLANLAHALRAPRPRAAARAVLAGRRDFRAGRLGARAG